MRKLLLSFLAIVVLAGLGVFLWARAVFTQDTVRMTLAAQLSQRLGQPVTIGSISVRISPRVAVTLGTVSIGQPTGIQIDVLELGSDFRALLSRRLEHVTAHLRGAKIDLPLIPLQSTGATSATAAAWAGAPVQLVSIDEIVISNVEVISAGRTLRGDAQIAPEPDGAWMLRRVSLVAEDASLEANGRITDLSGPVGDLTITGGELNLDRLIAFLNDFVSGATRPRTSSAGQPAQRGSTPNLKVDVTATHATLARMSLDHLAARGTVTPDGVVLQPLVFALFDGKYEGSLAIRPSAPGSPPAFAVQGALSNLDLPAVTRFASARSEPITGRASAQLDLTGAGADMAAALRSMHGIAHVSVRDGIVRNLGLVRAIVIATSMRGAAATVEGAGAAASKEAATRDEPFKMLRATLAIAGLTATTNDLQFEGTDVNFVARGPIALNGHAVNLVGRVQLSQQLSARAGTDLYRLTREDGHVTLPISITGPADALTVDIDVGRVLQRAIVNRAEEELKKTLQKALGGFMKKPK